MRILMDQKEQKFTLCTSFKKRFIGLMGKKNIQDIYVFPGCNGIHTFFMKEPIDVVLLKKDGTIIQKLHKVKPWRMILPKKGVYWTIELPQKTLQEKELQFLL